MLAMVLHRPGEPLRAVDRPVPEPGPGQILLRVRACAVCRTDLHVVDGELKDPALPLVPGHEIVGEVLAAGPGPDAGRFPAGARVGVPWLGWTCGQCAYCAGGRENLCGEARFTGYQIDGGFAEYALADARFCFPLPAGCPDAQAAPLLCAGLPRSPTTSSGASASCGRSPTSRGRTARRSSPSPRGCRCGHGCRRTRWPRRTRRWGTCGRGGSRGRRCW